MGYASIVGRVGALAVALGVGAAVATTIPAIAYAAPMDSESGTSTDASSPADTPSSLTSSSAPPAAGSSSGGSGSPGRSGSPNALVSSARSLSQSVRNNASRVVVRSSGRAHRHSRRVVPAVARAFAAKRHAGKWACGPRRVGRGA